MIGSHILHGVNDEIGLMDKPPSLPKTGFA